jgi:hypothetical protein
MAFGNKGKGSGNIDRFINAKYTSKDGTTFLEVPVFKLTEKQGDKYPELTPKQLLELTGKDEHPVEVSGNLVELTVREGEYEGSPVRSFKLALDDSITINNEPKKVRTYVDFGLGSMNGRTAANLLLNLKEFEDVRVSSWASFDKTKNKSYSKISVRQGTSEDTIKWKYDMLKADGGVPAPREFVGKGGKTERDFTEQEIFFFEKLKEFAKVVEEAAKKAPKAAAPKATAPVSEPANEEATDDQVPF